MPGLRGSAGNRVASSGAHGSPAMASTSWSVAATTPLQAAGYYPFIAAQPRSRPLNDIVENPNRLVISRQLAAQAIMNYFLANAEAGSHAANDELIAELARRQRKGGPQGLPYEGMGE